MCLNWGGEKRADFKREGGDGGGGPKPEGGGRRSPGVGPRAADQPGRTACRQRGSPKKPGIARALRLPLRQTSQALLLACTSTRRKMNIVWGEREKPR